MRRFTASETEHSARLHKGESFEISLPENPTTGFRWNITATGEPVSKMIDEDFHPGARMGGEGVHTWRFRATEQGESEIRMVLQRSWEAPAAPTQAFTLRVIVKL
jgi:inhibitor of cysteine peptidase